MEVRKMIGKFLPPGMKNVYKRHETHWMTRKHRGDAVVCPVCNSGFDIFGHYGLVKRENAFCYRCGSLERHRLLFLYLQQVGFFSHLKKIKLLHFAPEKMLYDLFSKSDHVDYFPCDIDPRLYPFTDGAPVHQVDITDIPFKNNTFDFIICNHVLEHIPADSQAMNELYRVMAAGGKGYFQAPVDYTLEKTYEDFSIITPKKRELAFGQVDHVRRYGKDYPDRLRLSGFKVTEDRFVKKFSKEELFKYGLDQGELIYFCEK